MRFIFTDDSYWDSPGCSCCEATLMEVYNSEDTDPNLGSAYGVEDCYAQAILTVLPEMDEDERELLYTSTLGELKKQCKKLGISVRFVR